MAAILVAQAKNKSEMAELFKLAAEKGILVVLHIRDGSVTDDESFIATIQTAVEAISGKEPDKKS